MKAYSAKVEETLKKPFGFKGTSVTGLTVSHVMLESKGIRVYGSGIQSVLWSDGNVFNKYGLKEGDRFMHDITRHALSLLKNTEISYPPHIIYDLFEKCLKFAKEKSGMKDLRKTFVLNALVPVDNALWLLYSKDKGIASFDEMLIDYKDELDHKNTILASVPLITYGITDEEIKTLLHQGFYFLKIKIGNGLEWDKNRVKTIHSMVKDTYCPYTDTKKPFLYLDANGVYESMDEFLKLIDFMDNEGILPQVSVIEEPFSEDRKFDVSNIPARITGDESCHMADEAKERMELGYSAIALKPIAKTLSATLDVLKEANKRDVPCFCADLTVTPLLVEWNKQFAARLKPFPKTHGGVLESNGNMNYTNWEELMDKLPIKDKPWVRPKNGIYELNDEFYSSSSDIFSYFEGEGLKFTEV